MLAVIVHLAVINVDSWNVGREFRENNMLFPDLSRTVNH